MRTLMDNAGADRPQKKNVGRELGGYKIEIAWNGLKSEERVRFRKQE